MADVTKPLMSDRDRRATTRGVSWPTPPPAAAEPARPTDPITALRALRDVLGTVCEDLFAAAPFPGDQATGHDVNRQVDELVGALRSVRAEVDDLARAMVVAHSRQERSR